MKKPIVYVCAVLGLAGTVVSGCSDDKFEATQKEIVDLVAYPDSVPTDSVDTKVFELVNLNYPGLEKVKAQYEQHHYYNAAYELLAYFRTRTNVSNPAVDLMTPALSEVEQNIADQALINRFYIRNFKESTVNGKDVYYSFDKDNKIDWETTVPGITDQEFRNQLHRHQWMPALAKAYRVTGNEDYVKSWIKAYRSWMKAYPAPREAKVNADNIAWTGLQPAERVRDRINYLSYFIQSDQFKPGWLSHVLTALAEEIECIRQNYYPEGSNIRLSQAKTVGTAGLLLPELKPAGDWMKDGVSVVSGELINQFNEDGVQNELDPSYHIAAISDFLDFYHLAQINGQSDVLPQEYIGRMSKAVGFVTDIIFPNYSIDNFNDTRNASFTKSVLLKNLIRYANVFPENRKIQWLASEGRAGTKPEDLMSTYAASGYYMLRSGWTTDATMMILKNNANPDNKWHCQPDNGTFAIYRNGRNFFPDAGSFSYGGTKESNATRAFFRTTKMHNTLTQLSKTIDPKHMNGKLLKAEQNNAQQLIVTENQSYNDLTHRRAVFFVNQTFFVIVDEAYGDNNRNKVNLNFHMPAGDETQVTVADDFSAQKAFGLHTAYNDNNNMLIRTFAETSQDFSVATVKSDYSNKLGQRNGKRLGYQLTIRKPQAGAARFITVIVPFNGVTEWNALGIQAKFTDNKIGEEGTFHPNGAAVEVSVSGKTYQLSYSIK